MKRRPFQVVQFLDSPFVDIDEYVCVPLIWVISQGKCRKEQQGHVTYPNEDPVETRERVKRQEKPHDDWRFYKVIIKHEADTYEIADNWIAKRRNKIENNDLMQRPTIITKALIEKDPTINDMQPKSTMNDTFPSDKRGNLSKERDNLSKVVKQFTVVQFLVQPFKGIDDHVCVPYTWVIFQKEIGKDQIAFVSYPNNEEPFDTRERVKRIDGYNKKWKYYEAVIKYESDTYKDAEFWIASQNNYCPIQRETIVTKDVVEEDPTIKDMQTKSTMSLNKKLCSDKRSHLTKSKDESQLKKYKNNVQKPVQKTATKRPAQVELMEVPDRKLSKIDEAVKSTNSDNDLHVKPGCSKEEQSIISQNKHLLEMAQRQETARPSSGKLEFIKMTAENLQQPLHKEQLDHTLPKVVARQIIIDRKGEVQINSVMEKPPLSQIPHQLAQQPPPIQYRQIPVTPSMETTSDNRELCTDISNAVPSTSRHLSGFLPMPGQQYSNVNGAPSLVQIQQSAENTPFMNIARLMALASQNQSCLMSHPALLMQSEQNRPTIIQNQSQGVSRAQEMYTKNSVEIPGQATPRTNIEKFRNLAMEPRIVHFATNAPITSQKYSGLPIEHPSFVRLSGQQNLQAQGKCLQRTMHVLDIAQRHISSQSVDQRASLEFMNKALPMQCQPNSVANQLECLRRSYEYLPINKDSLDQNQLKFIEATAESNSQTRLPMPCISRNPPNTLNTSTTHETSQLQKLRQLQPNVCSQGQQHTPKRTVANAPKNREVMNRTPPDPRNVLPSMKQALSATHKNFITEQQLQGSLNRSFPVESLLEVTEKMCQTNERMARKPRSQYHGKASDCVAAGPDLISHNERRYEAPIKTADNVNPSGNSTETSADKPLATQNLTSFNQQSRIVLEQQMLDNFASLFFQMGTTLQHTRDLYNNLRTMIHETADKYKTLLLSVDRFNAENATGDASNVSPIIPLAKERQAARENSGNTQKGSNVANKAPEMIHKKERIVLPPEHNPHDTKWTLIYQNIIPGLVELMPGSGIFVSKASLEYCLRASNDCETLVANILPDIFRKDALCVCSTIYDKALVFDKVDSVKPLLDEHASHVLLDFVLEQGTQRGWDTDIKTILVSIQRTILEYRLKVP